MSDYIGVLITGVLGLVAAAGAAFLSARWGFRQAYQERWWDRKEQTYREIIGALHDLLRYSTIQVEWELSGNHEDHPKEKEFGQLYVKAYWNVQRLTVIGPFLISETAAQILQKLRDRPKPNWEDGPAFELREQEAAHYREALDGIRKCARADLKV